MGNDRTRSERSGPSPRESDVRTRAILDAAIDAVLTEGGAARTGAISETAVDDLLTVHAYGTIERREHRPSAATRNTIAV